MALPKVAIDLKRDYVSIQSYATSRTLSSLERSTGHPIKDGHRVGSDDFYVFKVEDLAGLGTIRSFQATPGYSGQDLDDPDLPLKSYDFRPAIAAGWDTGYYSFDVDYKPLGTPEVPEFADFVLELNSLGTKAIKLCRPGNPVANLGQFTAELRDIPQLPTFLKSRAKKFKDLGHEYLNVEFGWKPFISDLQKAYKLSKTLNNRLLQIRRDNGLWIRRRRVLADTTDASSVVDGTFTASMGDLSDPSLGGSSYLSGLRLLNWNGSKEYVFSYPPHDTKPHGQCRYFVTETKKRYDWFVGQFRYYVPDIGSDRWTERATRALYGVDATPAVIWEVIPWSWLIDWWTNVGDILSNLSANAVDNEVMENTNVMSRRITERTVDATVSWDGYDESYTVNGKTQSLSIPPGTDDLQYRYIETVKLRHPANPYGFGVTFDSLSARQIAILAALGISRQRF